MKLYIRGTEDIFGMSFPRKTALKHLSHDAKAIKDHIIKCVLYADVRKDDMHHWIHDELSSWLEDASGIQCDSKLKKNDYLDTVFSEFGKTLSDVKYILKKFRKKYCEDMENPYPWFEIDTNVMRQVYAAFQAFISLTLPLLMEKDEVDQEVWYKIISPIFKF